MKNKFKKNLHSTFRAFQYRNYKLFFLGQGISLIGTWIQQVAMSWLIYSLTKSPLLMGIVMFAGSIPSLFISPFAGVLIDRINKYKALIIINSVFMLEVLILSILTLKGIIKVEYILLLSIAIGITNAIDMPLRQSFVVELIGNPQDLSNAISLNSTMFNLARLVGPAIAGILIARIGEGFCFLINALSYIVVIVALFAMKINYKHCLQKGELNLFKELKEGFNYAFNLKPIRNTIIYLSISSFIGMSYPVLMPIFAKEILNGNAQTLGFLMSASGVGALLGALYLASKTSVKGLEKFMIMASFLFGISLLGLGSTNKLWVALIMLFTMGLGMVTIMASCNTLIQHWVEDDKRGRVMSIYAMAFIGTAPLGSLFGGFIADKIGVPHTFLIA